MTILETHNPRKLGEIVVVVHVSFSTVKREIFGYLAEYRYARTT